MSLPAQPFQSTGTGAIEYIGFSFQAVIVPQTEAPADISQARTPSASIDKNDSSDEVLDFHGDILLKAAQLLR